MMPISLDAVSELLVRENEEYRRLFEKHRGCDLRLEKLNARHILTDEEKIEAITLKKHKLALKDRMAAIARDFANKPASRTGN